GIVGALIANWLLPRFGVHLLGGIARLVIESAIGATTLLLIIGLVGASGGGVSGHSSAYRR
ncbi:MAG TPA: GlsB/YeaQ/YmgE family stress response membrane protein, partial [Roseiarcus sp.]|nr:GlsB/YeaQ/YmgE family stress response membrane protein [Roseiarcus sp.]